MRFSYIRLPHCSVLCLWQLFHHSPILIPDSRDSAPARQLDPDSIADAVPRIETTEPLRKPGFATEVFGKRYHVMQESSGYREASHPGTEPSFTVAIQAAESRMTCMP